MFNLFQREWDLVIATNIIERKETNACYDYVLTMVDEKGE